MGLPKLVILDRHNGWLCLAECCASVVQFTPEALVGTVRLCRALTACVTGKTREWCS